MINKPTVLILGAGASMDYQYPSGKELKEAVIRITVEQNTREHRCLDLMGYKKKDIDAFGSALRFSGRPSVDAFLEYRHEFINIGKVVMALELIRLENLNTLFKAKDNWYEYLFNRMETEFSKFGENQIGFITFNYDRSLETYLHTALMHAYRVPKMEVAKVISKIPIIHVHGKLGDLPWEANNGREYKSTLAPDEIQEAAEGIQIISELSQVDEAFGVATELISNSDRVVFLGFGYHRTNLDRLGFNLENDQVFWGSCYGFTDKEKNEISEFFAPKRPIYLGQSGEKVLQFLRENILL